MNIRRAKKVDLPKVSKLLNKTFEQFLTQYFTKKGAEKFKREQLSVEGLINKSNRIMFVAEENSKIIGFIEADPNKI